MNIDTFNIDTFNIDTFNIDTFNMIMNHGFFYYPIKDIDMVNNMMIQVKKYFNLSLEKKMLNPHNNKGLGYIPMNRVRNGITITKESFTYIPSKIISPFDNIIDNYYNMMNLIAKEIFIKIMNYHNITVNKYNELIENASGTISILHYPQIKMNNNMIGISPHTDWGLLTILYTDMEGLQVQNNINNKWYDILPKKDHFIINIADMIEILTDGKYKSTIHRVINKNEKYSIAYFYEPSQEYIIKPFNEKSIYKSIKYGMYLGNKIKISTNNN